MGARNDLEARIELDLQGINGVSPYDMTVLEVTRDAKAMRVMRRPGIFLETGITVPSIALNLSGARLRVSAHLLIEANNDYEAARLIEQFEKNVTIAMIGAANRTHGGLCHATFRVASRPRPTAQMKTQYERLDFECVYYSEASAP